MPSPVSSICTRTLLLGAHAQADLVEGGRAFRDGLRRVHQQVEEDLTQPGASCRDLRDLA